MEGSVQEAWPGSSAGPLRQVWLGGAGGGWKAKGCLKAPVSQVLPGEAAQSTSLHWLLSTLLGAALSAGLLSPGAGAETAGQGESGSHFSPQVPFMVHLEEKFLHLQGMCSLLCILPMNLT